MSAQVTTIGFKGTQEQFAAFTKRCQVTEYLLSKTLAEKFNDRNFSPEELEELCRSWFESVRHMAVAHWISSGIQTDYKEQ